MAFVEDHSVFLVDFGVDVTIGGTAARGIFRADYQGASLGYTGAATSMPALELPAASVPSSPIGAAVVVPGVGNFTVAEHQPDGSGWAVLLLERAA